MTSKSLSKRLFVCLLSLFVSASYNAAQRDGFSSIVDKEQVAHLLGENQELTPNIGDFRKVDLDGDGREELVATADYSGREFYNTIVIAWQEPGGMRLQTIDVWDAKSLEGVLQDLDRDGKPEVVAQELLTPYLGTRPYAVWTPVRSLSGKEYVDASARFPEFYEKVVVPALQAKLSQADKHDVEVVQIAIDKVQRVLGRDREAGLQRAVTWSADADPLTRIYAAAVLKEIDSPVAAAALQKLANDSNREVSMFARTRE